MKKKLFIITLVIIILFIQGCTSNATKKVDNVELLSNILEEVINNKDCSKLDKFEGTPFDQDEVNNKNIENKVKKIIDTYYEEDSVFCVKVLAYLEDGDIEYKNNNILNYITENYWSKELIDEKIELVELTKDNAFYIYNSITMDDINNYPEEKKLSFYSLPGQDGYYDDASNKMESKYREIQFDGDILTVSYGYYGDFAMETTDREYLDSLYQIKHSYSKKLYFKGCVLSNLGNIDKMLYTKNYLISYTNSKIQIYHLEQNEKQCLKSIYLGDIAIN